MLQTTRTARRNLASAAARQVRTIYYGVNFPVYHSKIPLIQSTMDDRSTSEAAKDIFSHAISAVDKDYAAKVMNEKKWRTEYTKHVCKSTLLGAQSKKNALAIAKAGLDEMYATFDFFCTDGHVTKFSEAMQDTKTTYHTGTVKGTKQKTGKREIKVPYKCFHTGEYQELKGQALIDQAYKWAEWGTIEQDCADAIAAVVRNPEWMDLKDQTFVILGASSAMGPFHVLKDLGANIIAVDIDRPDIWKRLIEEVYYNSDATITFPMSEPFTGQTGNALYQKCGGNMIRDTPKVRNWVRDTVPEVAKGKPVTIGGYAYLDGELHVRVNLACDAIMKDLAESYGWDKTNLHFLPTPTDAYIISDTVDNAVKRNIENAPAWQKRLEVLQGMGKMVPMVTLTTTAEDGTKMHLSDSLMATQGPNYALAKRIQQWRSILAREQGATVSFSVAPATATASVLSNKMFAAAYGGAHFWDPVEIFYSDLSNAVMGILLVHDVRNPESSSRPHVNADMNPMLWLTSKAFHGGFMRCAYKFTSIAELAASIYLFNNYIGKYFGIKNMPSKKNEHKTAAPGAPQAA
jgi:hypothetical protein